MHRFHTEHSARDADWSQRPPDFKHLFGIHVVVPDQHLVTQDTGFHNVYQQVRAPSRARLSKLTVPNRPTTTGPVPTCEGTVHTIQAGDTCQSVSLGRGVSTSELLRVNNLEAFCNNFPTSGTLCIPSKKVCKPYQLRTDGSDTCASIGKANNATYAQIVSWNSDFGSYCNNLGRLAANSFIVCVSTPGGAWVHPSPGLEPTTSVPTTTTE